jgi:two-component sensor histidine kinase
METTSIISVVVFLLFLQMGTYAMLVINPFTHARILFYLSVLFAFWVLADMALPFIQREEFFLPVSPFGLAGWLILPFFMNWFFALLTQYPSEKRRRRLENLLLFLLALQPLLMLALHWLSFPVSKAFFGPQGPWPYFLAGLIVVTLILLIQKLTAWKGLQEANVNSIRRVFLPMVMFMGLSLFFEFIMPLIRGEAFWTFTPFIAIAWFPFLVYTLRAHENARVNPSKIGQAIFKNMGQAVFLCMADHSVQSFNPFARELFGQQQLPFKGVKLPSLFIESSLAEECLSEAVGKGYCGPRKLHLAGKTNIPLSAEFFIVKDNFHDIHGFAVVCKDLREGISLKNKLLQIENECDRMSSANQTMEVELGQRNTELAGKLRDLQLKISESMRIEEKIETDLSERDVLINEIHNRVINNMNLIISLVLSQDKGSFAGRSKFMEMAQRVRTILLVHQHLYLSINYSDVDFKGFIQALIEELLGFYNMRGKVDVELDLADDFLDVHQAIPLGIISNELIGNAFIHAWAKCPERGNEINRIKIGFGPTPEGWQMSISDNGTGLPEQMDFGSSQTIGLPLVEILVNEQLGGKMSASLSGGTCFQLDFPKGLQQG